MICCALFQPFDLWHAVYSNPSLKDKPLISLENNKVKHANNLAKQFNIKTGMSVEGAKANCHDLIIVDTTPTTLKHAWDDLLNQLYAFTNKIESPTQGVVYLDLKEPDATLIAESFQARVATADNKQHAHLLALSTQEGAFNKEASNLGQLSLVLLQDIAINPKTIERFHWLGLETLGDLQKWSKNQLSLYLGEEAKLLLPYLKGPFDKSISIFKPNTILKASYHFEDTVLEPWQINPVLEHLVSELVDQLGDKAASRLTLSAEFEGLSFSAARLSKEPLNSLEKLYRFAQVALRDTGVSGLGLNSLKLELSGIYRPSKQVSLFQQKETKLIAIQKVEERFPGSLLRFQEVNPYLPIPEFQFKVIPLGSGSEVKHDSVLSFRRPSSRRQATPNQRPSSLIHS